jgi:hypothetical protein
MEVNKIISKEDSGQKLINFEQHWIVKIDTKKITLNKNQIFDDSLSNILVKVSGDLLREFQPVLIYTYNLSIYLFFGFTENRKRINSSYLVGMICSYAGVRFNYYLQNQIKEPLYTFGRTYFGGIIFEMKDTQEQFNYLYFIISKYCINNSIDKICSFHFSKAELKSKSIFEKSKMLSEKGIEWNKTSEQFKYGILVKRKIVPQKVMVKNKKGITREEKVLSSKMYCRSMNIPGYNINLCNMLFTKTVLDSSEWKEF